MKVTIHQIESGFVIGVMAVLIALGLHVYFVTLPLLDTQAANMSLVAVQNGAQSRALLEKLNGKVPEVMNKTSTVLDDTHKVMTDTDTAVKSINRLVAHLDDNQEDLTNSTVDTLNGLRVDLRLATKSIQAVGDQTVKSEQSIAQTADAATDTAKSANKLVGDVSKPVVQSMQNVQSATGDFKDATSEAKQWFHKMLHPRWPKVLYGEVKDWSARIIGAWL